MKTTERFPYPVLSAFSDDIQNSTFESAVVYQADKNKKNYCFTYTIALHNSTIIQLLQEHRAVLALHFECGRTFFREKYQIENIAWSDCITISGTIEIPWGRICGKTEISAFVYADDVIENYQPEGLHPDYQQTAFTMHPGEILAASGPVILDVYSDYELIQKPDSIIVFRLDKERETGEIHISLNSDKINVFLPKNMFDKYEALRTDKQKEGIITSLLGIPVLMEGLKFIKETTDENLSENRQYRWFRSLENKLREMGINIKNEENTFEAAQKVFANPYMRAAVDFEMMDRL
ncbi:MAG TPA: hypothetical protein PKY88_10550 [Anaerohalosphaeraceae bacterium]|nr:hypothetical protein [Anaerohalosphaeraceae bacterium]